jgi:hypothetical protein
VWIATSGGNAQKACRPKTGTQGWKAAGTISAGKRHWHNATEA